MKVQRLCYYAQAWHLVWDDAPLFEEEIFAWGSGPVIPVLFEAHRGLYRLKSIPGGNADALRPFPKAQETIRIVLATYSRYSGPSLADLAQSEEPWKQAHRGLPDGARSTVPITYEAMVDFYGSLGEENATPV
jgi:uncharacterized phage-associated protein